MTGSKTSAGPIKAAKALRKVKSKDREAAKPAVETRHSGAEANRRKADAFVQTMLPAIEQLRSLGHESCNAIAWKLNQRGMRTARNGAWTGAAVRALLARAERLRNEAAE